MTKEEQEVINILPRLCDGYTCKQVILIVDELDTLREKLSKVEQILKARSFTDDIGNAWYLDDSERIRKIREVVIKE